MTKFPTNESSDDETEIILATRELILATQGLLIAINVDIEQWWPLDEAEAACATHCAWSGDRLPIRSVALHLRQSAADLRVIAAKRGS